MKAILIFGPPGIGKGTQAKLIGDQEGYVHFSTGELFRKLGDYGDIGKEIKKYVDNRELVPDRLTMKLAIHHVAELAKEGKFDPDKDIILLDGLPRDHEQVEMVKNEFDILQIIDLTVDDESILIDRIKSRAEKEGRADDQHEETVKRGLEVYHKMTEKILEEFPEDIILKVDGSGTVEEIHKEIMEKIRR
jgi:adenylate kinase